MDSIEQAQQPEISVPHTAITDIVERDAGQNPEAWSDNTPPLFGRTGIALGVSSLSVAYVHTEQPYEEYGQTLTGTDPPVEGQVVHARPTSTKAWLVNAYGSRWVEGPYGSLVLQTTPLERLPELHAAIANGVLAGEHSRPSKLVDNATHEKVGTYTKDDLRIWLETLRDGYSPIMATGKFLPDGRREYVPHDYSDWHTSSNLFWGIEIQDRETKAAGYELKRRDEGSNSPALGEGQPNGIDILDTLTGSDRQIDILDYAMHGPGDSPKERMSNAWKIMNEVEFFKVDNDETYAAAKPMYEKWQNGLHLDPEVAALNMHDLGKSVSQLEDFIQWFEHDGDRLASDEEKTIAVKDAMIGLTRIAEKLLGIHDGTALVLPEPEVEVIEEDVPSYEYPRLDEQQEAFYREARGDLGWKEFDEQPALVAQSVPERPRGFRIFGRIATRNRK
jgi:hypothetical protein